MQPNASRKSPKLIIILLLVALIATAGAIGWAIGKTNNSQESKSATQTPAVSSDQSSTPAKGQVKSLVSYSLPDGWKEANCPSSDAVFVVPEGSALDCKANPSAPVKISVDTARTTDCNQLQQRVNNVSKHICSSVFINGKKTLKSLTEYTENSSDYKNRSISAYYLNAGASVVKAEYIYSGEARYQSGFDELSNSMKAKD